MTIINNKLNINLRNKFIIVLLTLALIFIIANFYRYYQNRTVYEYADWLINYQGGFVRRGLIGELLFQFYKLTKINLGFLIFLFVTSLYLLLFANFIYFLGYLKKNWINLFIIFSPISILYPVMMSKVTGRKEILFLAFFSLLALVINKIKPEKLILYITLFLPVILLSHAGMLFFLPYILILYFLANIKKSKTQISINTIPFLVITFICVILIFIFSGTDYHVAKICDSIKEFVASDCETGGQIAWLKTSLEYQLNEKRNLDLYPSYLMIYPTALVLGFYPLIYLFFNSKFVDKKYLGINPSVILLVPLFLSIPIYYLALDWGRYLHISYICSVFIYFYCMKYKIITANKLKFEYHNKKFTNTFLLALFILYSFSWTIPHCCEKNFKFIYKKPLLQILNRK